ncbi:hypothetical protein AAFF_G00224900 [Aldrovandia affinis]|uniref:Stereocilin LRR domain-containing protein n=1 Tax=Aldrovandia affinis TaxID=143900 RepID=A0AAD7TAZ4_9TELE|nr:hypothetical protein AAFF_G00224900 [Aldrovandia affinis]
MALRRHHASSPRVHFLCEPGVSLCTEGRTRSVQCSDQTVDTGLVFSQSKNSVLSRSSRAVAIERIEKGTEDESEFERSAGEQTEENQSLPADDRETHARSGSRTVLDPNNTKQATGRAAPIDAGMSSYYKALNTLYDVYRPLLTTKFMEELPQAVVCILTGKEDCGLEADLTKGIYKQIDEPLRSIFASVHGLTCQKPQTGSRTVQATSIFNDSPWLDESTLEQIAAIQDLLLATLVHLPQSYSEYLVSAWNVFRDATLPPVVKYFSDLMEGVADGPAPLLSCHRRGSLAGFNSTACADVLHSGETDSPAVRSLCQALSHLEPAELELVWNNGCGAVSNILAPLLDGSDCAGDSPRVARSVRSAPSARSAPSVRSARSAPSAPSVRSARSAPSARSALSLSELMCTYANWTGADRPDPTSVAFCVDNDRKRFVKTVCRDPRLVDHLVADPANTWLWKFCTNASADHTVSQHCEYDTWKVQPVDSSVVAQCWEQDRERLEKRLCRDMELFLTVLSDPQNSWLSFNCSGLEPPTELNMNAHVDELCLYTEWHSPALISPDALSVCIQHDEQSFMAEVCANSTFLASLLLNEQNGWVGDYCTFSLSAPPTAPPPASFSISEWCNYDQWPDQVVDPSVVGLCWQHDQASFHKNVCCNMPLFEKLTQDPQNAWLSAVCGDKEALDRLPEVCRYSEWSQPTIVDMTDLALCAELDPQNFTRMVCATEMVLQNLMANLDNTWLVQYCANHSGLVGGGGGEGGGANVFWSSEQCQYLSWTVAPPDSSLLALCWDYDQANFVAVICPDPALLAVVTQEPFGTWVGTLCATYTNFTGTQGNGNHGGNTDYGGNVDGGNPSGNGTEPRPCPARDLVQRLNWTCSTDLSVACRPGASRLVGLRLLVRCAAEALRPQVGGLLSKKMVTVLDQVTSQVVVLLLALEESQLTSLHVTENIRLSVLESIMLYMEHETNFSNKRILLQCFGKVLSSLMQTRRDVSSDGYFFIKEYFRIPLDSLREVLNAMDATTIRQIMQYYSRNLETLQLSDDYLQTMVSVLFSKNLVRDGNLFPDLAPLLAMLPPTDILALPYLQGYANVIDTINANILQLSLEQRRAFGKWFGRSISSHSITAAAPSFIRDTGNLIAYLPFISFQYLSPAQLLDGLDVLLRNTLSTTKERFVAQTLVGTYRNLTAAVFKRLGNLTCLAKTEDLLHYRDTETFTAIQDSVRICVQQGQKLPSDMISSLFLNVTELQTPSSLSSERISELGDFLPWLGADFLGQLTPSQLQPALPILATVPFTPTQAREIVAKVVPDGSLELPGKLLELGSLVSGVKVETLWTLTSDTLLSALPAIALYSPGLSDLQANAITTKLWGSPRVTGWLDELEPLLPRTPLLSVQLRAPLLITNSTSVWRRTWNTQQAKSIFKEAKRIKSDFSTEEFLALGTVAQGVNCETLHWIFLSQSPSSLKRILTFLREQPVPLHTSLKTCILEELHQFDFFSQLLGELGSQIALELSVSTIKKFPINMMDTLRQMIVQDPVPFLQLPSIKQELLVDKIVQRLSMYTGGYTEAEFRSLGVMATFVADEVFVQVDRSFFVQSLDFLRGFCYSSNKRSLVALILQEPVTFGPVEHWTPQMLDQMDRFIFFLSNEAIQRIPARLMTLQRIERLFLSQQQWEMGETGALCVQGREQREMQRVFAKRQFVLQYFLGFLRVGPLSRTSAVLVPSCESLHATQPAAWSVSSLAAMPTTAFASCLELIGQDPFITPYELTVLLDKVKKIYGSVSAFAPSVIAQLGRLATMMSEEELQVLQLSDLNAISSLGSINSWTNRQLSALFLSVLNSTKQTPSQLDSSTLVALGHIVCGINSADMRNLNAVEFSKAVLWLGQLRLACSEEQLLTLVGLLSHSLAFRSASSWGSEVFIEIGVLTAGLPDMAMSSLVKSQIEGITPLAISLIPAEKFAVVFHHAQIRMFSYEQAIAVTAAQRSAMTLVQRTALSMVLTPWENKPVDFRGRSSGLALHPGPLSLFMELLLMLLLFFHSPL